MSNKTKRKESKLISLRITKLQHNRKLSYKQIVTTITERIAKAAAKEVAEIVSVLDDYRFLFRYLEPIHDQPLPGPVANAVGKLTIYCAQRRMSIISLYYIGRRGRLVERLSDIYADDTDPNYCEGVTSEETLVNWLQACPRSVGEELQTDLLGNERLTPATILTELTSWQITDYTKTSEHSCFVEDQLDRTERFERITSTLADCLANYIVNRPGLAIGAHSLPRDA